MNIIKPRKLKKGDTIGIIGISGKIKEYERIERAKEFFENEGYKVVISDTCKSSHRYMAGINDEDCINTLHKFFSDENINAILCARGGYGTLRLLPYIDWNIIKKNPKIFAGYSDITVLLNMILKNTGLITFHSAMPNGDFSYELEPYTVESFFETLTGEKRIYKAENAEIYSRGRAKGRLFGGNLSTLASLCGQNFIPKSDLILFLEDLNEPVYKIDKMLTQLFNIPDFRKRVKGIAFGEFKDVDDKTLLYQLLKELATWLDIPTIGGFKFTHNKIKDTIPVGIKAELNTDKAEIKLNEGFVE